MKKMVYNKNDTKISGDMLCGTDHLLDRKMAAKFLGVKEHTLAVWGITHRYHLPYIKVGSLVKYRMSDLQRFLEQNLHK